jgi:hypothetical protein
MLGRCAGGSDRYRGCRRARELVPDIFLRDVHRRFRAGEEHFAHLLDFVSQVEFDLNFVYSSEPGTPAATLPDAVPAAVARRRWKRRSRPEADLLPAAKPWSASGSVLSRACEESEHLLQARHRAWRRASTGGADQRRTRAMGSMLADHRRLPSDLVACRRSGGRRAYPGRLSRCGSSTTHWSGASRAAVATIGNYDGIHRSQRVFPGGGAGRCERRDGDGEPSTRIPARDRSGARAPPADHERAARAPAGRATSTPSVLPFTAAMAATPADRFVREIVVGALGIRELTSAPTSPSVAGARARSRYSSISAGSWAGGVQVAESRSAARVRHRIRAALAAGDLEPPSICSGAPTPWRDGVRGDRPGTRLGFRPQPRGRRQILPATASMSRRPASRPVAAAPRRRQRGIHDRPDTA